MLFRIEPGRVPDRHAIEVRPARVGVAHTLHDRQLARFEQLAGVGQRWVQADLVVDLYQALFRQAEGLAVLGIALVGKRYDRVYAVVAAVQLDDDEHAAVALDLGRPRGLRQEGRHGRRQGEEGG